MSIMQSRLQIVELCNTGMLYRRVIENLPHRIAVKDVSLAYILCNKAYARDLNIKPDEITGKSDHNFFPKEQAEKNITEENEVIISGVKRETEEKYMVSGNELTILATKTPIKNGNGSIIGLQIVMQDITQDKCRVENLISLNKNLEDLLVQGKEEIDALKLDLERITVQRNQLEAEIKDMHESMKSQGKQMVIRDAKVEKLKNDLQQETKEQKNAIKLLRKSFRQIEKVVKLAHLSSSKGQ